MPASELNQNVLWWQGHAWSTESEESYPCDPNWPGTEWGEIVIEIDKYSCIRIVLRDSVA